MASEAWVVAAANGIIVRAADGAVIHDFDGDGFGVDGMGSFYMHMATKDRPEQGSESKPEIDSVIHRAKAAFQRIAFAFRP